MSYRVRFDDVSLICQLDMSLFVVIESPAEHRPHKLNLCGCHRGKCMKQGCCYPCGCTVLWLRVCVCRSAELWVSIVLCGIYGILKGKPVEQEVHLSSVAPTLPHMHVYLYLPLVAVTNR